MDDLRKKANDEAYYLVNKYNIRYLIFLEKALHEHIAKKIMSMEL